MCQKSIFIVYIVLFRSLTFAKHECIPHPCPKIVIFGLETSLCNNWFWLTWHNFIRFAIVLKKIVADRTREKSTEMV